MTTPPGLAAEDAAVYGYGLVLAGADAGGQADEPASRQGSGGGKGHHDILPGGGACGVEAVQ